MQFYNLPAYPSHGSAEAPTDFDQVDPVRLGDAPLCHRCGRALGPLSTLPPMRGSLRVWTERAGDVVRSPGGPFIVSKRLWDCFQRAGLVGLRPIGEVEITKVKHRRLILPIPRYLSCEVARSGAAVDSIASGLVREGGAVCPECRTGGIIKRWKGVVLEVGTWTGEDIFTPRGLPGTILASARFAEMVRTNQLLNCNLTPAETSGHDFHPWESSG
jgi:hypothetical protein